MLILGSGQDLDDHYQEMYEDEREQHQISLDEIEKLKTEMKILQMTRGGAGKDTDEIKGLREKLEHLTVEQDRHIREKEDHHRERQKIASELQAERALINEHLVQKNQLQRNLKEAEKNIEDFKISISDLESKLSHSTKPSTTDGLPHNNGFMNEEIERLNSENDLLKTHLQSEEKQNQELMSTNENLRTSQGSSFRRMSTGPFMSYDDEDDDDDMEQKLHSELTESKQELREKHRHLTEIGHHREQEKKRADKLESDIKREREARTREEEKVKAVHAEKDDLRIRFDNTLKNYQELQKSHQELGKKLEESQSKISNLNKQQVPSGDSPQLKLLKNEAASYKQRFEAMEQRNLEANRKITSDAELINKLQEDLKTKDLLPSPRVQKLEIEKLQKENARIAELESTLRQKENEIGMNKERYEKSVLEIKELEEKYSELETAKERCEIQTKENQRVEIAEVVKDNVELQDELRTCKNELENATAQLESQTETFKKLEDAQHDLTTEVEKNKNDQKELKNQIAGLKNDNLKKDAELTETKIEYQKMKDDCKNAQQEQLRVTQLFHEAQKKYSSVETDITTLKDRNVAVEQEMKYLRDSNSTAWAQRENSEKELQRKNEEHEEYKNEINNHAAVIKELREDNEKVQVDYNTLLDDYHRTKAEYEATEALAEQRQKEIRAHKSTSEAKDIELSDLRTLDEDKNRKIDEFRKKDSTVREYMDKAYQQVDEKAYLCPENLVTGLNKRDFYDQIQYLFNGFTDMLNELEDYDTGKREQEALKNKIKNLEDHCYDQNKDLKQLDEHNSKIQHLESLLNVREAEALLVEGKFKQQQQKLESEASYDRLQDKIKREELKACSQVLAEENAQTRSNCEKLVQSLEAVKAEKSHYEELAFRSTDVFLELKSEIETYRNASETYDSKYQAAARDAVVLREQNLANMLELDELSEILKVRSGLEKLAIQTTHALRPSQPSEDQYGRTLVDQIYDRMTAIGQGDGRELSPEQTALNPGPPSKSLSPLPTSRRTGGYNGLPHVSSAVGSDFIKSPVSQAGYHFASTTTLLNPVASSNAISAPMSPPARNLRSRPDSNERYLQAGPVQVNAPNLGGCALNYFKNKLETSPRRPNRSAANTPLAPGPTVTARPPIFPMPFDLDGVNRRAPDGSTGGPPLHQSISNSRVGTAGNRCRTLTPPKRVSRFSEGTSNFDFSPARSLQNALSPVRTANQLPGVSIPVQQAPQQHNIIQPQVPILFPQGATPTPPMTMGPPILLNSARGKSQYNYNVRPGHCVPQVPSIFSPNPPERSSNQSPSGKTPFGGGHMMFPIVLNSGTATPFVIGPSSRFASSVVQSRATPSAPVQPISSIASTKEGTYSGPKTNPISTPNLPNRHIMNMNGSAPISTVQSTRATPRKYVGAPPNITADGMIINHRTRVQAPMGSTNDGARAYLKQLPTSPGDLR